MWIWWSIRVWSGKTTQTFITFVDIHSKRIFQEKKYESINNSVRTMDVYFSFGRTFLNDGTKILATEQWNTYVK